MTKKAKTIKKDQAMSNKANIGDQYNEERNNEQFLVEKNERKKRQKKLPRSRV